MSFSEFQRLCQQTLCAADFPLHSSVVDNMLVYDISTFGNALNDSKHRQLLQKELFNCLLTGPGVFIVRNGFNQPEVVDRVSAAYMEIIDQERRSRDADAGDHFATGGSNDRVWNALQKVCMLDPVGYVDYYANEVLAIAAHSWLGPGYQMTSQVNVVRPGSRAQKPHRDYLLGFQPDAVVAQFPLSVQVLSQQLTLQCAVAHSDMPVLSGPTKLLPFSQQYAHGYTAWRDPQFIDFFEENHVQCELHKGDIVFFNPALFHAAGDNDSKDIHRIANLLQIVSPMSVALEAVNRSTMALTVYQELCNRWSGFDIAQAFSEPANVIAATCDGFPFPTNLDTDPPQNECAPMSMAELMVVALQENWTEERFARRLQQQQANRAA